MSPSIDFSDVKGFDPIPAGEYVGSVVYAQEGTSQSGNPKIDIRWKIESGEFEGRQIFDTLSFHPNALFRVKQALQAFGYEDDFSGEVDPSALIGETAALVVTIEQSNGVDANGEPYKPRNSVKKIKALTGEAANSLV